MPRILLIEDDRLLCQVVQDELEDEHLDVEYLHDGDAGLACLKTHQYDLIILDWDLPVRNGIEIAKCFRADGGKTPILFLTGKQQIDDKAAGFSAGGDDYLTKPFEMRELVMRIKALLRRPPELADDSLRVGDLVLEPHKFRLTRGGADIILTRREFQVLEYLMRHRGQVFSAETLLDRVWSMESDASISALRACVVRLRRKIDTEGKCSLLQNIYGLGYKLDLPAD